MTELERYKKAVAILTEALKQYTHPDSTSVCDVLALVDEMRNPPPEFETVEVVRWMCMTCGDSSEDKFDVCVNAHADVVKLTGTRQIEKPQKVERSVELRFDKMGGYEVRGVMDFSFHGKRGTFVYSE